jgi:hypothetical protein
MVDDHHRLDGVEVLLLDPQPASRAELEALGCIVLAPVSSAAEALLTLDSYLPDVALLCNALADRDVDRLTGMLGPLGVPFAFVGPPSEPLAMDRTPTHRGAAKDIGRLLDELMGQLGPQSRRA